MTDRSVGIQVGSLAPSASQVGLPSPVAKRRLDAISAGNPLEQPLSFGDEILKAVHDFFAWGGSLPIHAPLSRLDELQHLLEARSKQGAARQRVR